MRTETVCRLLVLLVLAWPSSARSEDITETYEGDWPVFYHYYPPSTLVVPETAITRAKYPFVDVHSHLFQMADQNLADVVADMDALNMAVMVNLSGRSFNRSRNPDGSMRFMLRGGDYLATSVENARNSAPGRFLVFTNIDTTDLGATGWLKATLAQLETDVANGAQGLKIYKSLGFDVVDYKGERVAVDDERLDPIWARCGELGIPVLIHSGEPAAFWLPKDKDNERLFELIQRPERYRDPELVPSWEQIMGEQHNVFAKHPGTTFISAHLGWMGNDLAGLGEILDRYPNVYTEIGAVLGELGRQPKTARAWFVEYQDRVLFGKDAWTPAEYHVYFRVLETNDEYFDYYRRRHAFWKMYGMALPDEVLRKLYYENALRILPGLDRSLFPE
ncbi:MAG: amidohydrolase family protein [Thermoanaerobaculia bacterium]